MENTFSRLMFEGLVSKKTILIVDDDAANRLIIKSFLDSEYEVIEAESAENCLEILADKPVDLFLLDINMPGMNGYELCAELRRRITCQTVPITFVSALETPEERLAGFEAGGNGFLVKPVERENLLKTVSHQLAGRRDMEEARKNSEEAMKVAMEAMTSNSELGQILQFVKDSQQETTLKGVGKRLCEVTANFGLSSCAVIYGEEPVYVNCEEGSVEANILLKVRGSKERIISRGVRTIICSDYIAILVKDMPVDDDSRYGRFKDHLAVLATVCDGRLLTIQARDDVTAQRENVLGRVISITEKQVQKLNMMFNDHDKVVRDVMMGMIGELESKLLTLGLEEDQEAELVKLAYGASDRLEATRSDTRELERELGVVLEGLYELLGTNY